MPLYEYKCGKCGCVFECLVARADADSKQECPECGAARSVRQMSAFSVGAAKSSSLPSCPTCTTGSCDL